MKKVFIILTIAILNFQCNDDEPKEVKAYYNQEFTIKEGQKAIINSKSEADQGLALSILSITDNRCSTCTFYLNANISLDVSGKANANFCLGECEKINPKMSEDSTIVSVNNKNYVIYIKDLSPFPNTGEGGISNKNKKKSLKILVTN